MIRNPEDLDQSYVPSLTDTRCLVTTDAVMLDGANSVCGASRHPELWHEGVATAVFCAVALSVAAASIGGRRRRTLIPAFLVCGSLLACLPGLYAVLLTRADAPRRVSVTAARVASFVETLMLFHAGRHVLTVDDRCLECDGPLLFVDRGRLPECRTEPTGETTCLVPPNQVWSDPDGRLDLAPGSLTGTCRWNGAALTCGR